MDYHRALKYSFDLAPAAGWTYTVTFEAGRQTAGVYTVTEPSKTTAAFAAGRHRSQPTSTALPVMAGPAYLVLLDNRDYTVVPVTLQRAGVEGETLTLQTQNSAPPETFNRGALFVDGLPTPA